MTRAQKMFLQKVRAILREKGLSGELSQKEKEIACSFVDLNHIYKLELTTAKAAAEIIVYRKSVELSDKLGYNVKANYVAA